ncbi:MAG: hypothetical protein ACRC14_01245 [Paracoccaceae bacterium]
MIRPKLGARHAQTGRAPQERHDVPHSSSSLFSLFWHANRNNDHEQSRVLGLLEKEISQAPDNPLPEVFKACVLLQMAGAWRDPMFGKRFIAVADEILGQGFAGLGASDKILCSFAAGISCIQLPAASGHDAHGLRLLTPVVESQRAAELLSTPQMQEAWCALSVAYEALGQREAARDAFVQARHIDLTETSNIYQDYLSRRTPGPV